MNSSSITRVLCRLAALVLALAALWTALSEATHINIYKHRYPFYGGHGYGGPWYGGYGGGYGGGFRGGISIGGGGWGR